MTTMEQIAEISCLARENGMTYGAYLAKYGSPFSSPVCASKLKKGERICKVCKEVFQLKKLNSGSYSARKTCPACEAKQKNMRVKPMRRRTTKEYVVKCSECGRNTVVRQAPGGGRKQFCPECRPIVNKRRRDERYAKIKAGRGRENGSQ